MTIKSQDGATAPLTRPSRRRRWAIGTAFAVATLGTMGGVAVAETGGGPHGTSAQQHSYYVAHHASVVQSLENPRATRTLLPTFGTQTVNACDKNDLGLAKSQFTAPTASTIFKNVEPTSQGQVWQANGDVYTLVGGEQLNPSDGSKRVVIVEMRVNQCSQSRDLTQTLYQAPAGVDGITFTKCDGDIVSFSESDGAIGRFNVVSHTFS